MQSPDRGTQRHVEAEIKYAPSEEAEGPHPSSCDGQTSSARQKRSEDEWNQLVAAMADMKRVNAELCQKLQDMRNEMTDIRQSSAPPRMENRRQDSFDLPQDEFFSLPPPGPHGARGNPPHANRHCQITQPSSFFTRRQPLLDDNDEPFTQEKTYRGPMPTIPPLTLPNPREFSRMKIALENLLPKDATERFKFQILTNHLNCEEALLVADSFSNSRQPYTSTMRKLTKMYGQPHKLAIQRIAELMNNPCIKSGDVHAFRMFALRVRSMVGMLEQQGDQGYKELDCCSHAATLLSKLPHNLQISFKRFIHVRNVTLPTLIDLEEWLDHELEVQEDIMEDEGEEPTHRSKVNQRDNKPTAILSSESARFNFSQSQPAPLAESQASKGLLLLKD